jgi:hypothetical protein
MRAFFWNDVVCERLQIHGGDGIENDSGTVVASIRCVPLASTAHRLLALHVLHVVGNSITAFAFMQGDGADDWAQNRASQQAESGLFPWPALPTGCLLCMSCTLWVIV